MASSKISALGALGAALVFAACSPSGNTEAVETTQPETTVAAEAAPTQNIVQTAAGSPDFTTLVAAVQAAGLVETLSGPGPFTVFAPTNSAFAKLPDGTVDTLVMPANRAALTSILTYHVVAGRITAADLLAQIEAGGGAATVTTVEGDALTARVVDGSVVLTDARGGSATVTSADMMQSNGVIHVIDAVVMPAA